MRLVSMLAVAALAGLLWAGVCLVIGLPLGFAIAGAVLGAAGGFVAAAVCLVGANADALERERAEAGAPRSAVVAVVRGERFSREESPSPSKDRVA
jgi:hypothetical protein